MIGECDCCKDQTSPIELVAGRWLCDLCAHEQDRENREMDDDNEDDDNWIEPTDMGAQ